jgi:glycerol-3-phosphate dehydrogenase (NAD(P)+)
VALVGTHLDEPVISSVETTRLHPKLGVTLPSTVTTYRWDSFGEVLNGGTDLLILGVSSAGVGWAIDRIAETLGSALPVLMITKGLVADEASIEVLPRNRSNVGRDDDGRHTSRRAHAADPRDRRRNLS